MIYKHHPSIAHRTDWKPGDYYYYPKSPDNAAPILYQYDNARWVVRHVGPDADHHANAMLTEQALQQSHVPDAYGDW